MADKELRRMNRTELIEVIYALEQNEQKLQEEKEKLSAELEDRKIRLEESGSIAEAALSLNHIFEDAQAAADQYLLSLQKGEEEQQEQPEKIGAESDIPGGEAAPEGPENEVLEEKPGPEEILEDARHQADQILEDARKEADDILASAREDAQAESQKTLEETKEQCDRERQAVQEYHDKFMQDMSDILKDNPELLERVRKMGTVEGA